MRHLSRFEDESTELSTIGHFSDDYGDEPIFKCQNCASKNPGYEEKEASLLTIIAAVVCLLVFRLYSFLILPLVVESTKTIIKKCVKCDHVLDKQELLSVPSLTDKILSFKCGSCAMVISRKYALVIIAILSIIWFFIPSSPNTVVNPGGLNLQTKWEDFVEDCGKKVVLSNQVRAKRNFDNKYANNNIEWTGIVHSLIPHKDIANNPFIGFIIMTKMNPSDSKSKFPDIQLVFSNNLAARFASILNIMQTGDVFEFKGILRSMGDEFHFHDIEASHIHLTGIKMNPEDVPTYSYVGNANNMRRQGKTPELESSSQKESTDAVPAIQAEPSDADSQGNDQANKDASEPDQTQEPVETQDEKPQAGDETVDNVPSSIDDQDSSQAPQTNDEPQVDTEPDDQDSQGGDQVVQGDNEPNEPGQVDSQNDQTPDEPVQQDSSANDRIEAVN